MEPKDENLISSTTRDSVNPYYTKPELQLYFARITVPAEQGCNEI